MAGTESAAGGGKAGRQARSGEGASAGGGVDSRTMRAIVLDGFGGEERMRLGEVPRPTPGPGEVLVRVAATSVNRPDLVQREGNYAPPPGESEILGLEIAGRVEALGDGVDERRIGDRVFALVAGGGYAEYAVARDDHCLAVPDALTLREAACIAETYLTAWLNVFELAALENGESALLHGGGGGVNTAALQLCRVFAPSSTLYVTASAGKLERVRELGADHVFDYRADEFAKEIRSLAEGRGVDVILDHLGAPYLADNQRALAVGGRLVAIGIMGGAKAELNIGLLMVKRQRILGSVLRSRPPSEKAALIGRFGERVMPRFAGGELRPLVSSVMPLAKAADAHRAMAAGTHFGKIVLEVDAAVT